MSASGGSRHWPRRFIPPPEEPGAREAVITRLAQQRHGFMRTYITDTLPRLSLFANNMHVHISRRPHRVNRAGESAHLETRPQYLKALSAPLSTCKMRRLMDAIRAGGSGRGIDDLRDGSGGRIITLSRVPKVFNLGDSIYLL